MNPSPDPVAPVTPQPATHVDPLLGLHDADAFVPGPDPSPHPTPVFPVASTGSDPAAPIPAGVFDGNRAALDPATQPTAGLTPGGAPGTLPPPPAPPQPPASGVVFPDVPTAPAVNPAHVFNGDTLVSTSLGSLGKDDPAVAKFHSDIDAALSKGAGILRDALDKLIDGAIAEIPVLEAEVPHLAAAIEAIVENGTSPLVGSVIKAALKIASPIVSPFAYSVGPKLLAGLKAFRAHLDGEPL